MLKKITFIITLVVFTLPPLIASAQTTEVDSLETILQQHARKDTIRVNLLNKTAYNFNSINNNKLLKYAEEAGELADSLSFVKGKAESLRLIGLYYWAVADYSKAIEYYQKSLDLFKEIKDKSGIANCYFNMGTFYKYNGNFPNALKYYQKLLKIRKELGNKRDISIAYDYVGNIYSDLGNYPKSLESRQKALAIREKLGDKRLISLSYNNIGAIYGLLDEYSKALEYYQKGLKVLEGTEDRRQIAMLYMNIGIIYKFQNDYSKAREYSQKSLQIYFDLNYKKGIALSYIDIGILCRLQGDFVKALDYFNKSLEINVEPGRKYAKATAYKELSLSYFEQSKMKEAYNYSRNAYLLADEIGNPELLKESSEILAKSCNAIGKYKEAYKYFVIFKTINDSIYNEKNTKEIARLEYQYKYEREIEQVREKQRQASVKLENEKNIKYFLSILLIILIVFVVFIIISKQKLKVFYKNELKLSKEIKEIDDDYKEILDANSDVVFMLSIEGKQLYFNKQVENLLGYSREEVVGGLFTDFIPKSEIPLHLKKLKEGFLKKEPSPFETTALHKDGSHIPVEITAKVMKYKGKTVGVGTIRDITKRKEAALEIRKLSLAVEQSSATIVITDTDGRIEYANPFFTKITGYTLEDAKGVNPRILKSGHTSDEEYKELWNTITSGKTWKGVFLNVKENKEKYWEKAIISPVKNDKGEIINYVAVKDDITKQKEAEHALKESEAKLQESNKTKDKFFSIIAHDLKSPFNALLGYSNILLRKHKEYDEEKREKMIKSINNSANNTFKLLENLLTWSRSQSDRIEYLPEKLDLKILLFEVMFNLQEQANKKNIQVLDTISENELVFVDKNMMATVFRNLISNAIKFTSKNGTIVITSEKQLNSNFLEISVTDTGVGIPKDKIDLLFRIEENTSTEGTENETGTGLGLILCKEFVEKHGGNIWVESEEGKGSTFLFTIPEK